MTDTTDIQKRLLGGVLRNVRLVEVISRLGLCEEHFSWLLRPVWRTASRGHIAVQAAVKGSDVSAAGIATRKLYEQTSAIDPELACHLARLLIESPEPVASTERRSEAQPVGELSEVEPASTKERRRRKPGAKAQDAKAFLEKHIMRTGRPVRARRLEEMARVEGVLALHETIRESQRLRRAAKQLGITSCRVGYGEGGYHEWRPPKKAPFSGAATQPVADTI